MGWVEDKTGIDINPINLVQDGWDSITGQSDKDKAQVAADKSNQIAGEQLDYAKTLDQREQELAENRFTYLKDWQAGERDYQRGTIADNRNFANQEYDRRLGITDTMVNEAKFNNADYDRETGRASTTVRDSFSKAAEMERRNMGRYGVNPSSGRFRSLNKRNALNQAVAEANSINNTRRQMKTDERGAVANARSAALGVGRTLVGPAGQVSSASDPRLGLQNLQYGAMGNMADRYAQQSIGLNQSANARMSSTFGLAGDIAGAFAPKP